jgi:uncharacterized protein (TIGR03067 family)
MSELVLLLALSAAPRAAGSDPEPPPPDSVILAQGTWEVTRVLCRGAQVATGGRQFARFEKDTLVMGVKDRPRKYRYRIDPKKKPRAIDIDLIQDKRFWPGIYKIEKDILTFAVNNPGEGRPSKFDRTVAFIYYLRRVKK